MVQTSGRISGQIVKPGSTILLSGFCLETIVHDNMLIHINALPKINNVQNTFFISPCNSM